jgi:hypothetical protein
LEIILGDFIIKTNVSRAIGTGIKRKLAQKKPPPQFEKAAFVPVAWIKPG